MRTTLTLADDVASEIDRRRRDSDRSFKDEVDHLLRLGLLREREGGPGDTDFRITTFDGGGVRIDVTDVGEALELSDGPDYR